jgi:hypothetical protein
MMQVSTRCENHQKEKSCWLTDYSGQPQLEKVVPGESAAGPCYGIIPENGRSAASAVPACRTALINPYKRGMSGIMALLCIWRLKQIAEQGVRRRKPALILVA